MTKVTRKGFSAAFLVAVSATLLHAQTKHAQTKHAQTKKEAPFTPEEARATVTSYCTGCHNDRSRVAGFVLNPASLGEDSAVGEKMVRKLRMRTMPPVGSRRPDETTYTA